ncbi:hypothetical protein LTR56_005092 [Elasticomyces elasticus]|nr:hypothetical protein LTR22_021983 [Elasticomyces elasticus]KAK3652382.1 hypothetical protein LTR56_005092 [Elasticomyces elasticus]KAK4921250.1 hypothetical protein LTR49_011253 [Elasticomyces elasticus]KAK5748107.1 hypothetical protein LTS12_021842 [Elasticomyces elasticus]
MSDTIDITSLISRVFTSPFITTYLPQALLVNYAASHTSSGSIARWTCFFAMVGLYLTQVYRHIYLNSPISDTWVASACGGMGFWNCVTFFDRLIGRGWDYEHYYPKGKSPSGETQYKGSRKEFANEAIASPRGVGTWWEVKGVPAEWSSKMSREWFCVSRGLMVVPFWILYNMLVDTIYSEPYRQKSFHLGIHETWVRELEVRAMTTFNFFTRLYLAMNLFVLAGTIIGCLFDGDSFKTAKPLYGNIQDAYSLRRFWGSFWHQNLRSGLEGTSNFVVHRILRLPHRGLVQRYAKVFWSFALSGLFHVANDLALCIPIRETGAMSFFLLQACGFVLEDGVQALWRKFFGKPNMIFARVIGYSWTAIYLSITAAQWIYPANRYLTKEGTYLTWSCIYPVFVDTRM